MFTKIKDKSDTKVRQVVLIDSAEDLYVFAEVMTIMGLERIGLEVYKYTLTDYMIELYMPFSRYAVMMRELQKRGYSLKDSSKVGIICRLFKMKGC